MNNSKKKEEKKEEEEEDDDDIIINDDFEEEGVVVNSMTVELFKSRTLSQKKEDKNPSKDGNKNTQDNHVIDTKDVDSELPFDSKLVYQDKSNALKEEDEPKNKLTIDQVESDEHNEKLTQNMKNKGKKEAKGQLDENINIEIHTTITSLLLELEDKNNRIKELEEMALFLNNKLEAKNEEVLQLAIDIDNKKKMIEGLICKNNKMEEDLEQRDNSLKNHMTNTKTISACNKSLIRIEKQLAASFDQINRLTNENFLLKQTINKFYSSTKIKANTNQATLNSSLTTNPTNEKELIAMHNHINHTQVNNTINHSTKNNNNEPMSMTHSKSSTIIPHKQTANSLKKSSGLKRNNTSFDVPCTRSQMPYPIETAMKESKILEIESILYKLQRERDKLNEELTKLPEFPKQKNQITKKKSIENSIEEYNNKINTNKQKLVDLNIVV